MALIVLRFLPVWRVSMVSGVKSQTCRHVAHGMVGDRFQRFGVLFELTEVKQVVLSDVALCEFSKEGCDSTAEFLHAWSVAYPEKPYDPKRLVWRHVFKEVT